MRARRILFRLLAEDEDPAFLFELAPARGRVDPTTTHAGRTTLREAAASALAQAGYESDPRLRGAARRIIDRLSNYLRSPLAQKPWVRVGNRQVLAPEAAPPSVYALTMLAYMPLFRSEQYPEIERLYADPKAQSDGSQLIVQADDGHDVTIIDAFEAVGACLAGKITREEVDAARRPPRPAAPAGSTGPARLSAISPGSMAPPGSPPASLRRWCAMGERS